MTASSQNSLVRFSNLTHSYGDRRALDGVSFEIQSGSLFGLLGPNGSGKSTLFHLLSTLIRCAPGSIWVDGLDISKAPAEARRRIGVLFQSPSLDVQLTVRENLQFQGYFYGLKGKRLRTRIDELLNALGVADRAEDRVKSLSGGLKRRVEVAKCMLHEPQMLIMDEPTVGMDPLARASFWSALKSLRESMEVTALVTSHLLEEMEQCDQIGILKSGQLLGVRSPDAWKSEFQGEESISIECESVEEAWDKLSESWKAQALKKTDGIQIAGRNLASALPKLIEQLGDSLSALKWSQPSLEDVFIRLNQTSQSEVADSTQSVKPEDQGGHP